MYQAARILHLWEKAREILDVWDALTPFDVANGGPRVSFRSPNEDPLLAAVAPSSPTFSLREDGEVAVVDGFPVRGDGKEGLLVGIGEERNRDTNDNGAADIYRAIRLYCQGDVEVSADEHCTPVS